MDQAARRLPHITYQYWSIAVSKVYSQAAPPEQSLRSHIWSTCDALSFLGIALSTCSKDTRAGKKLINPETKVIVEPMLVLCFTSLRFAKGSYTSIIEKWKNQ